MATIQEIKTKISNANALGRQNLSEKGVEIPETATTYDIMLAIAEIVGSSGSGTEYTSIVYNDNNTVTLTDKDGIIHTMSCTYEDGKLIGVTYDGKAVDLTYNGDVLAKVGKTAVDLVNAPNEPATTFNIAYGETAPEDTSKLWIKANEPANVKVSSDSGIIISNAHLPTACYSMACAAVGNKVYIFGGANEEIGILDTINVFDTETEIITTLSSTLPKACFNMACAVVGTKIYLLGGRNGRIKTINVFDTETETITTLPTTLPTGCYDMGCASIGNKIYLFGGYDDNNERDLDTIRIFDTETETITELSAKLPTVCLDMGCAAVGNKIYLFGGDDGVSSNSHLDTINVFDTETETITTLSTKLPIDCLNMGCASIGSKIYLLGGVGYDSGLLNTINVFDTETETITTLSTTLLNPAFYTGCASIGSKIYLFGGHNGNISLNTINVFDTNHKLTQGNIEIQSGSLTNKFSLINTENAQIEIGVENVYIGNENNEAELCEAYMHNGTEWVVIE